MNGYEKVSYYMPPVITLLFESMGGVHSKYYKRDDLDYWQFVDSSEA